MLIMTEPYNLPIVHGNESIIQILSGNVSPVHPCLMMDQGVV